MSDHPDDYDFIPTSVSSNLASLFGNAPVNAENSSLIYTAPKQPKSSVTVDTVAHDTTKVESSVICARVVQVWKLINGKYTAVGKHGLAIIGSSVQTSYEVILYKEKRNVIMRAKISPNFQLILKKDHFVSFYDSAKNNWLIKFNSSEDCTIVGNNIEKYGGSVTLEVETVDGNEKESIPKKIEDNATENRAKADILSRIAKMGQSILPNKNVDSEEESLDTDINVSTDSTETTVKYNQHLNPTTSELSPAHVIQSPKQIQNIPNTVVMGQSITYDPLHFYIAENSVHNSEVRINLSQISEKLNHIMKLVDSEKPSVDHNHDTLTSKIKVLQLKNENLTKEQTILQVENSKLKQHIKNHEEATLKVDDENKLEYRLAQEREATMIENYEKQINAYRENTTHLCEVIEEQKNEIEELKNTETTRSSSNILEMENIISDLKNKLKECESHQCVNAAKYKDKNINFVAMLKDEMNGMYGNMVANFNEDQQYQFSEISGIIAQNIKSTTLKIIHNFQEIYENEYDNN